MADIEPPRGLLGLLAYIFVGLLMVWLIVLVANALFR